MAVDAPHAAHPERLSYRALAERIDQAAAAFRSLQIGSGDVVGLFAENSPRWLVADQGLMRAGAIDAVRGAAAPVEELRYILEDSSAVALVVQTADLLQRLQLPAELQERLRFVLVLEGSAPAGALDFDAFLALADGQETPDAITGRDRASAPATSCSTAARAARLVCTQP